MNAPALPASLVENPRLDRWIRFLPDRTVRIATGKVEIGQGVVTALGQIAADELDLPLGRVTILSGDTVHGPDEMYTTSSLSRRSRRKDLFVVPPSITTVVSRRAVRSRASASLRSRPQAMILATIES